MEKIDDIIEKMEKETNEYIELYCPLTRLLKLLSEPEEDNEMSRKVKEIRKRTGDMVVYNDGGDIITL